MGLVALAVIALGVLGATLLLGLPRGLWAFVVAALLLGGAGYVLSGHPTLPGHPVAADSQPIAVDPGLIQLRDDMIGRFAGENAVLTASDALIASGSTDLAANLLLGGIRKDPRDAVLWTMLGDALAQHDGGIVSPAALFAFQHAMRLDPRGPLAPFFLGLAYVRAGDFNDARPYWADALMLAPPGASYRPEIAVRLDLLDRYLAMAGAMGTGR